MDPKLPRSIVELGMVRHVQVRDARVEVELALTISACPLSDRLAAEARAAVESVPGVEEVIITLAEMTAEEREIASAIDILPAVTAEGIKVMSMNLLLPDEDTAVIWRGPLIHSAIQQFWTDVLWGRLDYLLVDLPPGTSDAALTVMQSLPVDGVIVVTTPQDLAAMVVRKAVHMAEQLDVSVLGVVENMSYFVRRWAPLVWRCSIRVCAIRWRRR